MIPTRVPNAWKQNVSPASLESPVKMFLAASKLLVPSFFALIASRLLAGEVKLDRFGVSLPIGGSYGKRRIPWQ